MPERQDSPAANGATAEILDACCGGRMWWWDKAHPLASDLFSEFIRAAQERAKQPAAPSYAERLHAINADDERRSKIEALAEHGATEGERQAALAALARLDDEDAEREAENAVRVAQDAQDEDDYMDALQHGAA